MKRKARVALTAAVLAAGCGGSTPPPVCRDSCPSAGQKQCVGASVQSCVADAQGCLAWGPTEACPSGGTCDSLTTSCSAATTSPCGTVTAAGICDTATSLERCLIPTGGAQPELVQVACGQGESCQIQSGHAACVLTAVCAEGSTRCASTSAIEACTNGGWVTSACPGGCEASALNAYCKPTVSLTSFSGRLLYQALVPNGTYSDWTSTPSTYYAQGVMVMARGSSGIYDVTTTDSSGTADSGKFTVQVPATLAAGDELVFVAAADDGTGKLAYCVADPGFSTAAQQSVGNTGSDPAVWSWSVPLQGRASGGDITIKVADGSGAATVFDNLRWAYTSTRAAFERGGPPLVVWVGYGTRWDCGACFGEYPVNVFGVSFPAQLWLDGSSEDQGYWSDAVTEHELGHWVMWAYGTSPDEGGTHYIGVPTYPGQAWSEGWATYFSADRRDDPRYVDKQQGAMFWLDIGAREYAGGTVWQRPAPSDGLLGMIDENEVAAMTWSLRQSSADADQAILHAIASARLAGPSFARGYTQHTWDVDSSGRFTNVVNTGFPVPCFADFLDALNCGGFSRNAIDTATQPAMHYAYPTSTPYCQ